jgi:uncharacterized protein involved in response to NO
MQLLGMTQATAKPGLNLAVYLIVLLIAILVGRVILFFTERGIAGATTRKWKAIEYLSLGSLVVLLVLDLAHASPLAITVFALLAALGHGIRLFGWYQNRVWSVPLFWVLHLEYAWLVIGFLFKSLSEAGLVSPALAIHAFTAGGIGTVTLGMMTRVARGHTGRDLGLFASQPGRDAQGISTRNLSRILQHLAGPGGHRLEHGFSNLRHFLCRHPDQ